MNTTLSNHGYKVIKSELIPKQVKEIKDELNVKPYTFNKNLNKDSRFPIFLESPKKLYLPRFYGIERFGEPKDNTIEEVWNGEKYRNFRKRLKNSVLSSQKQPDLCKGCLKYSVSPELKNNLAAKFRTLISYSFLK